MSIDLRSVFSGKTQSIPIDEKFDFSDLEVSGINPISSPISVVGSVFMRAEVVRLEATASFVYKAPCDRCCAITEKTFEIPIDHIIVNSSADEDVMPFVFIVPAAPSLPLTGMIIFCPSSTKADMYSSSFIYHQSRLLLQLNAELLYCLQTYKKLSA